MNRRWLSPRTLSLLFLAAALLPSDGKGQMLARPGWAGSGMAQPIWWKHAVLYEIDVRSFSGSSENASGDLKGAATRMEYVKSLGVDAILLDPLQAPAQAGGRPEPIDPALGTLDDFDTLSQQASRQGLRVLVTLKDANIGLARFWLSRGVAGFYLAAKNSSAADVQALRKLLASYVGGRILITDADLAGPARGELLRDLATPATAAGTGAGPELAAQLRGALEQMQTVLKTGTPLLATGTTGQPRLIDRIADPAHAAEAAKVVGTILMLHRGAALIYQGEELGVSSPTGAAAMMPWGAMPVAAAPAETVDEAAKPTPPPAKPPASNGDAYVPYVAPVRPVATARAVPAAIDPRTAGAQMANKDSALNFYRTLIELHHGNNAFKDAEEVFLNHDDASALVWMRRPPGASYKNPAIVVVCNLSDKPLSISLKDDIAKLHLRGNFLRKILRSDGGMGSAGIDPITLPGYGVYVGELKY
jgi:alpha-glucosidase